MINTIPLRARKRAQTKLALMKAVIAQLQTQTLEEVSIKEVCSQVQVSEATFFNYFPRKCDVLTYFIQLWTIEISWYAQVSAKKSVLSGIQEIFDVTGRECEKNPNLMAEIIAYQAKMLDTSPFMEISLAERLLAFPDLDGADSLPAEGLRSMLPELIQQAVDKGELPTHTNVEATTLGLASVLFGVPLLMIRNAPNSICLLYKQQLAILWKGLDAL